MIGAMSFEKVGLSAAPAAAQPPRSSAIGQLNSRRYDKDTPQFWHIECDCGTFTYGVLLGDIVDRNVECDRVHSAQALELHPNAIHARARKGHGELDVLLGTA
jgi:hypothetical protein